MNVEIIYPGPKVLFLGTDSTVLTYLVQAFYEVCGTAVGALGNTLQFEIWAKNIPVNH